MKTCCCHLMCASCPCHMGSRVGVVVRALAFHQCVPGSIPGPGVICGLSLLVLYSAPRGFSPGTPVFPSPQKPTFDLIWFDLFDLQSPQLVQHSCSARMIWDSNKVIIIIIIITWLAVRNDSAIPWVATPALYMISDHPQLVSHFPSIFNEAISIWSPPIMAKNLSSSNSGIVHWTCFAKAYKGWSRAITGVCKELRYCTAALMTFMLCAIIANECAFSVNIRSNVTIAGL